MSGRPDLDPKGDGAQRRALTLDFLRESDLWDAVPHVEALVETAILATIDVGRLDHLEDAELSVVLTDDQGIRLLNQAWRAKDTPTNVLSFPAAAPDRISASPMLGDIVLAFETIDREAVAQGIPVEAHLTHLVVHGFLHLFGYDHQTDSDGEVMEKLETAILATLGVVDPHVDRSAFRAVS